LFDSSCTKYCKKEVGTGSISSGVFTVLQKEYMRLSISFQSDNKLTLPLAHNELIQGFIYHSISADLAKILHDHGFPYENRNFKLFTFSRLNGTVRLNRRDKTITFEPPVTLNFCSPVSEFVQEFGNSLLLKETHRFGSSQVTVSEINVEPNRVEHTPVLIKMLSPMTMYSTLSSPEGKKKTYYYSPQENEFSELIRDNLLKKYKAFHDKDPEDSEFIIKPEKVSKRNYKVIYYKNFRIDAWNGIYRVDSSKELIEFGLNAGFGGKNSQGFGCGEVYESI
jgi:CRISPR-associated endoribonuclease Cas6